MKKKYIEDLEYFLNYVELKRGSNLDKNYPNESMHLDFYFLHSKNELKEFVNNFINEHKIENNYDFYYLMCSIIKYMGSYMDAHTSIIMNNTNSYPLSIQAINNKIYVTKCYDEKYSYSELLKINEIDIKKIIDELEKCTCYGTYGHFLSKLHFYLNDKNKLLSLPSISDKSKYIEYKTTKGTIKFEIDKDYSQELFKIMKEVFQQIQIRNNILVLKYPKCKDKFVPNIEELKNIIYVNNIDTFILDLRGNTGGNSSLINPLIRYLEHSKLNLFTLVNRTIFSSGRTAAIDMLRIGSKIVGQDIGTPINCFGSIQEYNKLPNTKFVFSLSSAYLYEDSEKHIMKGIYTKKKLHEMPKNFYEPKYLKIDHYINLTIEDYKLKHDAMLDKCCDWINDILNK